MAQEGIHSFSLSSEPNVLICATLNYVEHFITPFLKVIKDNEVAKTVNFECHFASLSHAFCDSVDDHIIGGLLANGRLIMFKLSSLLSNHPVPFFQDQHSPTTVMTMLTDSTLVTALSNIITIHSTPLSTMTLKRGTVHSIHPLSPFIPHLFATITVISSSCFTCTIIDAVRLKRLIELKLPSIPVCIAFCQVKPTVLAISVSSKKVLLYSFRFSTKSPILSLSSTTTVTSLCWDGVSLLYLGDGHGMLYCCSLLWDNLGKVEKTKIRLIGKSDYPVTGISKVFDPPGLIVSSLFDVEFFSFE
ncbi:hypothetical protein P9112_000258 [Eukaryota sp. TZLM1-RC]